MGKVYRTMQGREIDLEKLMARNELMPAIGNANMNTRGDEIDKTGKIKRSREQIMSDYYEKNPKAIKEKVRVTEEVEEFPAEENENLRGQHENKRKS